jgi:hypothetical protein
VKAYYVEQGTDEWRRVRAGIPTASSFHKIVTPTGKFSAQARDYACTLVAEHLLGRPLDGLMPLDWVERGRELEPQAAKLYEMTYGVGTLPVGFITNDAGTVGCSPDRLIEGVHAGLEIKCPKPNTHIGYIADGFGADYRVQAQGQIWVAEFEYVDRYSFHPELPAVRERTYRDDAFIAQLEAAMDRFLEMRDGILEAAIKAGALRPGDLAISPLVAA